jgi:hypothetical protein
MAMERHGDEVHITTEEARGGVTNHGVRYVLAIGLLLAIVALSAIWITGAFEQPRYPEPEAATQG